MLTAVLVLLSSAAQPGFLDRAIGDRYGRIVIEGRTSMGDRVILGTTGGQS